VVVDTNAVFISYRRADSAESAGRIYDRLVERFGEARVFKDVDSIQPGVDFADYIVESIGQSAVELVIIDPRWLTVSSGAFRGRRLDDPGDFVRIEIETALRQGVPVIPVLVAGAPLPPAQRLPDSLRRLFERNAIQVRSDPDFRRDMDRVIAAVEYWMSRPRPAPVVSAPPQRAPTSEAPTAPPSSPPITHQPDTTATPDAPAPLATAITSPAEAPAPFEGAQTLAVAKSEPDSAPGAMETRPTGPLVSDLATPNATTAPTTMPAPTKPPSDPIPAKRRRIQPVIAIVGLALVVALLVGALYSFHSLGGGSSGPSTADATNTALSQTAIASLAQSTQTAVVSENETATVNATPLFPSLSVAPGCNPDRLHWAQAPVSCSADHSRLTAAGAFLMLQTAQQQAPFSSNYEIDLQVANIGAYGFFVIRLQFKGCTASNCIAIYDFEINRSQYSDPQGPPAGACYSSSLYPAGVGYYNSTTRQCSIPLGGGTHTVVLRVKGQSISCSVDGKPEFSGNESYHPVLKELDFGTNFSVNTPVADRGQVYADISELTIKAI
jgi:hypothetical protein